MLPRPPPKTNSKKAKSKKSKAKAAKSSLASLSSSTPSPAITLQTASVALQRADPAAAASLAATALARCAPAGPYELHALGLLATAHIELGDHAAARTHLLRAVELDPDGRSDAPFGGGADKFLWLAQLSEEGGADSVSWLGRGADALRREIATLTERMEAGPARPPALGIPEMPGTTETPRTSEMLGIPGTAGTPGTSGTSDAKRKREAPLADLRNKLGGALCAVAEVYMTDLSWEADAETRCEAALAEATMVADGLADVWQTVANMRISQARTEEARAALRRSLGLWRRDQERQAHDEAEGRHDDGSGIKSGDDDGGVPQFSTRVGLVRLLLEVDMGAEAMEVVEGLLEEDDESVEVWYLGGWGLYLEGKRLQNGGEKEGGGKTEGSKMEDSKMESSKTEDWPDDAHNADSESWTVAWIAAREWLERCLKFYAAQKYEDERLGEHAAQLLADVGAAALGGGEADDGGGSGDQGMDGGGWEDEGEGRDGVRGEGEDVEMAG